MAGVRYYEDVHKRQIRLTDERLRHIQTAHPELADPFAYLTSTLKEPDQVIRSRTDERVERLYRYFATTPVTSKFLCVVVKAVEEDPFIITMYFTDAVKQGKVLWKKP